MKVLCASGKTRKGRAFPCERNAIYFARTIRGHIWYPRCRQHCKGFIEFVEILAPSSNHITPYQR